jgi:hypothetical protein
VNEDVRVRACLWRGWLGTAIRTAWCRHLVAGADRPNGVPVLRAQAPCAPERRSLEEAVMLPCGGSPVRLRLAAKCGPAMAGRWWPGLPWLCALRLRLGLGLGLVRDSGAGVGSH